MSVVRRDDDQRVLLVGQIDSPLNGLGELHGLGQSLLGQRLVVSVVNPSALHEQEVPVGTLLQVLDSRLRHLGERWLVLRRVQEEGHVVVVEQSQHEVFVVAQSLKLVSVPDVGGGFVLLLLLPLVDQVHAVRSVARPAFLVLGVFGQEVLAAAAEDYVEVLAGVAEDELVGDVGAFLGVLVRVLHVRVAFPVAVRHVRVSTCCWAITSVRRSKQLVYKKKWSSLNDQTLVL